MPREPGENSQGPSSETPGDGPQLKRTLSLPWVVLYGLGVTIGAGIYVLLGATVARAGIHAPMAFVTAAIVMVFSAASFVELSGRFPVSAGEAAYVKAGFRSNAVSLLVGLLVISSGVVSSAAVSVGSAGYIREFFDIPDTAIIGVVVLAMGGIAAWGIRESVVFASLFTLIETGALLFIIVVGFAAKPDMVLALPDVIPPLSDMTAWFAVAGAGLLAFFAFIGFEDMVNLAEEIEEPGRTLNWAIFITLILGTLIYFLVAFVSVLSVPLDELGASDAPLSLIFHKITGASPAAITLIAIVATLNGVIIQIIMASRVLYGLGKQGSLPSIFARINRRTRTPLIATGAILGIVLLLALAFPVETLAEMTSRIVLVVFTLVNTALLLIKLRAEPAPVGVFRVWTWVPVAGALTCVGLLASDFAGL